MPQKEAIKTALEAKQSFKENPLAFALRAIIRPALPMTPKTQRGGLMTVALELMPSEYGTATTFHGQSIPIYYIVPGDDWGKAKFRAYWCPYENDQIKAITLWRDADFMFTAMMDGCTFGVGSQNGNGAVRVAHVNQQHLQVGSDKTAMETKQAEMALGEVGSKGRMLQPAQYRKKVGETEKLSSLTFGVRNGDTKIWSFYSQLTQNKDREKFILRGLKKFA